MAAENFVSVYKAGCNWVEGDAREDWDFGKLIDEAVFALTGKIIDRSPGYTNFEGDDWAGDDPRVVNRCGRDYTM